MLMQQEEKETKRNNLNIKITRKKKQEKTNYFNEV
jgi:hypothetical protein